MTKIVVGTTPQFLRRELSREPYWIINNSLIKYYNFTVCLNFSESDRGAAGFSLRHRKSVLPMGKGMK
jgi:hypothetical protein